MVATPDLAIAKAALSAALLRPDPKPLTRGAVEEFIQLLDNTVDECSRPNVQKCKNWIVANVAASSGRAATLGRFLVALSESMETDFDRPSVRRRRLHVLYIVNDVLHHVVTRQGDRTLPGAWDAQHLPAMVATASTFEKCPRHLQKVQGLITLWEERGYLSPALTARLRESSTLASDKNSGTRIHMSPKALELAKEAPYVLPSLHGDPSAHWSDLPAACWLAQLAPNSTLPMRRALIRPAQLTPGPASDALTDLVKATISDAEDIYRKEPLQDRANVDTNPLGEVERSNEPTEQTADVDTYWGWSRQLCLRQKERQKSAPRARRSRSRLRTRNTSPRTSESGSPRRRRFRSRSRERDRSRGRSRRRSRSSSGIRGQTSSRARRRNSSYSRSRSRSRSRSPAPRRGRSDRQRSYSRTPSRSHSRSRSRSGPPSRRSPPPGSYLDGNNRAPQQTPNPPPHSFPAMPPQGPGSFPVPPPPPPPPPPLGYQGTFPPPPLHPLPQGWSPSQSAFVPPHMAGGAWGAGPVSLPPPPPPPPFNGHQQHNNHWGRGNGRGGGRGYRGRGRGGNGRGGGYGYGPM